MAVLTGGVITAAALLPGLFVAAPARADGNNTYKAGAVVLGAASAYLLIKGKTLPGVVAGAGAYYAYKKSKNGSSDQYSQYPGDDRYGQNGDVYPGDNASYPRAASSGDQYPDFGYSALAPVAPPASKQATRVAKQTKRAARAVVK